MKRQHDQRMCKKLHSFRQVTQKHSTNEAEHVILSPYIIIEKIYKVKVS